jgi:hypothetical protein
MCTNLLCFALVCTQWHDWCALLCTDLHWCTRLQVPQYILEDSWAAGQNVRIVCTQPRRISAITVSERVAAERGEQSGDNGSSVGYQVRIPNKTATLVKEYGREYLPQIPLSPIYCPI